MSHHTWCLWTQFVCSHFIFSISPAFDYPLNQKLSSFLEIFWKGLYFCQLSDVTWCWFIRCKSAILVSAFKIYLIMNFNVIDQTFLNVPQGCNTGENGYLLGGFELKTRLSTNDHISWIHEKINKNFRIFCSYFRVVDLICNVFIGHYTFVATDNESI